MFRTARMSSEITPTALVLAYNLSKKPWSQVLTLYLSTCSTVCKSPSLPLALPSSKFMRLSSFSGLWCSSRTVLGPPWFSTARPWPVCFVAASSSADLIKGMIRDWTALSNYRGISLEIRKGGTHTYIYIYIYIFGGAIASRVSFLLTSSTSSARLSGEDFECVGNLSPLVVMFCFWWNIV